MMYSDALLIKENASGDLLQVLSVQQELLNEPVTVYNFEVEDWHMYYVSEEELILIIKELVYMKTRKEYSENISDYYEWILDDGLLLNNMMVVSYNMSEK